MGAWRCGVPATCVGLRSSPGRFRMGFMPSALPLPLLPGGGTRRRSSLCDSGQVNPGPRVPPLHRRACLSPVTDCACLVPTHGRVIPFPGGSVVQRPGAEVHIALHPPGPPSPFSEAELPSLTAGLGEPA